MLIVDAANVIGSRPTGWWRDRPGAARRFVGRVRADVAGGHIDAPVVVVLEGQARAGVDEGEADRVRVVHAPGSGDDAIVDEAEAQGREAGADVVVVTADRALAARCREVGASIVGPSWLLDRLS